MAASKILVRLAIATISGSVILAWALFDLDTSWLALGGGLAAGNLLAWAATYASGSVERALRWVLWTMFAGLALSFIFLRNAFLTFCFFGALLAMHIHYFVDRYREALRPTDRR